MEEEKEAVEEEEEQVEAEQVEEAEGETARVGKKEKTKRLMAVEPKAATGKVEEDA